MQIVLYYKVKKNPASEIVSFLTGSDITHASIINNRINYDTDLYKDEFSISKILDEEPDRDCIVFEIPGNPQQWIDSKIGVPYDLLSYFLWIFGINRTDKMHCFDTVMDVLRYLNYNVPNGIYGRPTGQKLFECLSKLTKGQKLKATEVKKLYVT